MRETLRGVAATIPEDATILALVGEDDFVYALYGPNLTRRVHTVSTSDLGVDRWNDLLRLANERGAGWILDNGSVAVEHAPGWEVQTTYPGSGWTLLKRS